MSTITPMGRLKDVIINFKKTLGSVIKDDFTLQESKPKYNPHGGSYGMGETSKGVENEFLRIFKTGKDKSFAFIFNNIKEDLDKVLISISIKTEENLKSKTEESYISRTMSFEEFKNSLKECIRTLKVLKEIDKLDEESLYVSLNNVFRIDEDTSTKNTIEKIISLIDEDAKEIKNELKTARTQRTKSKSKLEAIIKKNNKELDKHLKSIGYAESEKEFLEAEAVFLEAKKKFQKIKNSKKLRELTNSTEKSAEDRVHKKAMDKVVRLEYQLKEIVRKHVRPYEGKIKDTVTDKVLKKNSVI